MDEQVLAAMARWPSVPAVAGWLSLDVRGQWRLHPDGRGREGGPGTSISNPQILAFISRNYSHDNQGRWFFQNGPQRVYVRLDATPRIAQIDPSGQGLMDHTTRPCRALLAWLIDEQSQLYLVDAEGPLRLDDRALPAVIAAIEADGQTVESLLDSTAPGLSAHALGIAQALPLERVLQAELPARFGYQVNPQPD
jgi:hypothetical protein